MTSPTFGRRQFIGFGASVVGSALVGCGAERPELSGSEQVVYRTVGSLQPDGGAFDARVDQPLSLTWNEATGARGYDIEINGRLVATEVPGTTFDLRFGDRQVAPTEGANAWRVRPSGDDVEWSQPAAFEVRPADVIRRRAFNLEDDGPIELTVPSRGAALLIGSEYAFLEGGKGVALRGTNAADTRAYKNHIGAPVAEMWIRVAVRPGQASRDGVRIDLGRIRSSLTQSSEHLVWQTGRGIRSSSGPVVLPAAEGEWTQAQLGVLADGTVELWLFDGVREALAGTVVNKGLAGEVKDTFTIGNVNPNLDLTYEVWLDEILVGRHRLPWLRDDATPTIVKPTRLDPETLPDRFSFVYGSCHNASYAPYTRTAVAAAAEADPDFVIHLGDYGYADSAAYQQTTNGYLALWTDLAAETHIARLLTKPWLMVASDHDLGGNNVIAETIPAYADRAFQQWHDNDRTVDGRGDYGSMTFDDGRLELVWVDALRSRTDIVAVDGPDKTILGAAQLEWLLERIATSPAGLLIVASQTTIGHDSLSGWQPYHYERGLVIDACRLRGGPVRWLSGDQHSARWADFGGDVVEWGAAPLMEVPQGPPPPNPGVVQGAAVAPAITGLRDERAAALGRAGLEEASSFGWVQVDTITRTVTFEVRDRDGEVRRSPEGHVFREIVRYGP